MEKTVKITITKEEFIKKSAKLVNEILSSKNDALLVMLGGVFTCKVVEKLFKDNDTVSFDENEYCGVCADIISKLFPSINTLFLITLSGELKLLLFNKEEEK